MKRNHIHVYSSSATTNVVDYNIPPLDFICFSNNQYAKVSYKLLIFVVIDRRKEIDGNSHS